jgi:hypothetical protein
VTTAVAEVARRAVVVPGPRLRCVLALTRIEGRRLVTHPAILVGPGLLVLTGARGPEALRFLFLSGIGFFVIGLGTLLAASICASRSLRDGTGELLESLPLRAADRTAAHLLSVAFPLTATLAIAGVLAMATRPWPGASARLDIEPRLIMHGLPDFALGPLLVGFLGVTGVLLARWFSTPVAVPVAIGGIIAMNTLTDLSPGALHWLNPGASYSTTAFEPASVMTWHLAYVSGFILLVGLGALIRRPRSRGLEMYGAAAVGLTTLGGVMQVLAASP